MTRLSDDDLDAIVACLPDCVEVYGPYRPRHAPECRHDDITALVAEVRRLRWLHADACREVDSVERERDAALAERDRLWAKAESLRTLMYAQGDPEKALLDVHAELKDRLRERAEARAERDRLRDGIREHRAALSTKNLPACICPVDPVEPWAVEENPRCPWHGDEEFRVQVPGPRESNARLWALLDDQENVVLAERCACGRHLPCRHCNQEETP